MGFIDYPATVYTTFQRNGVICLSLAALISLFATLYLLIFKRPKPKQFENSHIFAYFMSLIASNAIQAFGTLLNFAWVGYTAVMEGTLCNIQGGIKNFGNVSAALWTTMITVQLFNLLFVRWKSTRWGFWMSMVLGWGGCLFIMIIGPAAIQKPGWPSYFGPSGAWCWISDTYKYPQIFMEYFLEYLSVGLNTVLYTFIILRVRGNLIMDKEAGKWKLRKVPVGESWRPCYSRDYIDTAVINVSRTMVWFPIAYTILLIPVSIARFSSWAGKPIPFDATILTDVVYSLMGLVDVLLLLYIKHLFPDDIDQLPQFHTPKATARKTWKDFTLSRGWSKRERAVYLSYPERAHFPKFARKSSAESAGSDESWGNDKEHPGYF